MQRLKPQVESLAGRKDTFFYYFLPHLEISYGTSGQVACYISQKDFIRNISEEQEGGEKSPKKNKSCGKRMFFKSFSHDPLVPPSTKKKPPIVVGKTRWPLNSLNGQQKTPRYSIFTVF